MALNDHRIVNYSNPVSSLPDHPSAEGITAAQLKAVFDSNANNEIKTSVNGIINNLLSKTINDSGADNIGSTVIPGVNGENVRAQLVALKNLIDTVVLGQIPDGTITDAKLSNAPGQVKEQINNFAPHLSEVASETITATRDISLTGVQKITGFSKKPKTMIVNVVISNTAMWSIGQVSINMQWTFASVGNSTFSNYQNVAIALGDSSNRIEGVISINPDKSIDINWSKLGTGKTGTARIVLTAIYHGED